MSYSGLPSPGLVIQHTGQLIPLAQEPLTIGRAADNVLVLADPQVSAYHAVISWQADRNRYLIEDRGSTNGTYLNERRLGSPAPLRHGDSIRLGNTVIEVRLGTAGSATGGGEATSLLPGHPGPPLPAKNLLLPAILVLLMVGVILACLLASTALYLGSRKGVPTVTFQSPPDGAKVVAGNEIILQAVASAASDITLVELRIDGGLVATATSADPTGASFLVVSKPWTFDSPGQHNISAVAHTVRGKTSRTESIVLFVLTGQP